MEDVKNKPCYSHKEKLLRAICIFGIAICVITAILLLFIERYLGSIIIILACGISAFLLSGFFTKKVKSRFGGKKRKRLYYVGVYVLLLLVCMVPTLIVGALASYNVEDVATDVVEYAENTIKNDYVNIEILETDYIYFEHNDSFYFELETTYTEYGVGGVSTSKSVLTYVQINKYTKRISRIDFVQFMNAYSYQ